MLRPFLIGLLLILVSMPASAWGPRGHRLTAHLAADALTPTARAEVARLLHGEPDPTLAGISNWADELRTHDPDLGRRSAKWHYVNLGESGCKYAPARDCPGGDCVVEAIRAQAAVLADRSRPQAERRQALKFIVHFVGDVHQPMHAGYAHDLGGNRVQLNLRDGSRDGHGTNLHALWDSGLFRNLGESERTHLARLRSSSAAQASESADPAAWAEESCRVVLQPGVYPRRHRIDNRYIDTWRPVAEQRIVLAGRRLAALLNQALDD